MNQADLLPTLQPSLGNQAGLLAPCDTSFFPAILKTEMFGQALRCCAYLYISLAPAPGRSFSTSKNWAA
jgi:hypothetical protein